MFKDRKHDYFVFPEFTRSVASSSEAYRDVLDTTRSVSTRTDNLHKSAIYFNKEHQ